jgi:hypothetical protein
MRYPKCFSLLVISVMAACGGSGASDPQKGSAVGSPGGSENAAGSGPRAPAGEGGGGSASTIEGSSGNAGSSSVDAGQAPVDAAITGCAKYLGAGPKSGWVSAGANGKLVYQKLPAGDQIMDFSFAGYGGGGVPLPNVPMVASVAPSGGDDTAPIQAAIDSVSAKPLTNGLRGAVVLQAGSFRVSGTLTISASGVVLRGSGSGKDGTSVQLTGSAHRFLDMQGEGSHRATGNTATVSDDYVPSGATTFHVDSTAGFAAGDTVLVSRTATAAWIHFMGMDTLVRDGQPQTWIAADSVINTDRAIQSINGNQVTLDVPLSDSFDRKVIGAPGTMRKYTFAGRISQVGLENLQVNGNPEATPITEQQFELVTLSAVVDGWVKNVVAHNCQNTIHLSSTTKRITLEDVQILHDLAADGSAGYPLDYTIEGTQHLMQRCSSIGDNVYTWATGARVAGPLVVLNSKGAGAHNRFEPHQRWATGLLGDNVTEDDQINFYNRTTSGSGHGWTIGWGVIWNSSAATIDAEAPPGSMNWAIGCKGKQVTQGMAGTYESLGTQVAPQSLYLAQLCDRLGPDAVANLGY